MKRYCIVCGVYGVGKSTLIGILTGENTKYSNIPIINVDQSRAIELLTQNKSIIHETTLADSTAYNNVMYAKEKGYYIELIYVAVSSPEESIKRVKNRVSKGGHHIDDECIIQRFKHRFVQLKRIIPLCNKVKLYDNENGYNLVCEYTNGKQTYLTNNIPYWYTQLQNDN